jgi:hypothetical protein
MTTMQQRTIFLRDKEYFPNWEIVHTFIEPSIKFYCGRSNLPLSDCENIECSKQMGHVTKTSVGEVEKAVIRKIESNIYP